MEFSSSSKRAKTPANGNNIIVSCLVDGCNADLSQCREYHRRHKVCEVHSKTPKVTIAGREQRFCQQCSRFHALSEFDEGKRSCRKRLDGHNRRRRKPQADPISRTTTTFLSNQQGIARILSFNSPQVHLMGSSRAVGFKPESPFGPFNNQPSLNYQTRHHLNIESSPPTQANQNGSDNHFNFIQQLSQPPTVSSNQMNRSSNSRALSLLSSSPPTHQTPTIIPPMPSVMGQYGFGHDMLSESSGTTLQFQGMFNDDHGGSSSSGIKQQTLSFRWD
ncbi:uncharacterized protein [Rutidosis leptorrhynchoides]|uniref:uncharacterized protein n=1 Tax=Rutidosis leptorrhynchoides TaxID=125765 RepID=UPI003A9A5FC6